MTSDQATGRLSQYMTVETIPWLDSGNDYYYQWQNGNEHGCMTTTITYIDKKENQIFLIYKEIQNGEKSYMRKGFLIYEELRKYLAI
jgi:hypothetical protein